MFHFINLLFPPDPKEQQALAALRANPVTLQEWQLRTTGIRCLDRVRACTTYDEAPDLQKAVYRMKYRRSRDVAAALGALLAEASEEFVQSGAVLCPVPLHWTRWFSRGFNQSDLLAQVVAQKRGAVVRNLLRRQRATGTQTKRKRAERFTAMQGAFAMKSTPDLPSRAILIDDLFTTGATMDACALVLKNAGVQHVEGLVLALG